MSIADKLIQARLNAKKRIKIYNPSLDTISFDYDGKEISLRAQEITTLKYHEAEVAIKAIIDHLINKDSNTNIATEIKIQEWKKEILV